MNWFKRRKEKENDYNNINHKLNEAGNYLVELAKECIDKYCEFNSNFDIKDKDILLDISGKKEILDKIGDINSYKVYARIMFSKYNMCIKSPYLFGIAFKYIKDNICFIIEDVFVTDIEDKNMLCVKIKESLEIY